MVADLRQDETGHVLSCQYADGAGVDQDGSVEANPVKTLDIEKHLEHVANYMMIAIAMAVFIGFSLGWLAWIFVTG